MTDDTSQKTEVRLISADILRRLRLQGFTIIEILFAIVVIAIVLFLLKRRGGSAPPALEDMAEVPEPPEAQEADVEDAGTEEDVE